MKRISPHISYAEATKSYEAIKNGLDNTPGYFELKNMEMIAQNIFEPVRLHFGVPIYISSFYSSPEVAKKIKGRSKNSQHLCGKITRINEAAIDLDADFFGLISNSDIFGYIRDNLSFDQLIWEYGDEDNPSWVHVSYREHGNRKQICRKTKSEFIIINHE